MKIEGAHVDMIERRYRIKLSEEGTILPWTIIRADEESGECDLLINFMPEHFSFGAGGFKIVEREP